MSRFITFSTGLSCRLGWVLSLAAALSFATAALGAERSASKPDVPPLEILGNAEIGQITQRSADAVFRVDHRVGKSLWLPRATAFVIHSESKRLLLVTNAHVVEDSKLFSDDVDDLPPEQLRIIQRGNGDAFQVTAIYKHPRRADALGPDVAVLDVKITDPSKVLPPALKLLPHDRPQSLLGSAVGLIGFPAMEGVKLTRPYFGGGVIAQEDDDAQHVIYDMAADQGSSGSPVFIAVREQRDGKPTISEYVVAVHAMRHGDRLKTGMHARLVWEAIEHHKLLQEDRRSLSPTEKFVPYEGPSVEVAPIKKVAPTSVVPAEFSAIVKLAEEHKLDEAARQVTVLMQSLQSTKKPIAWEVHCLAGAIATRRGLQLDLAGKADEAKTQYGSAMQALQRAIDLEPDAALPKLLLARAQNNFGRPTDRSPTNRKLLQATHDEMQTLLERDDLSDREKAQANYLLGFVHQYLPCGTQEKIRGNFANSVTDFPSKQGYEWYQRIVLGHVDEIAAPDLWNEFEQLAHGRSTPKPEVEKHITRRMPNSD